jgi:hypothetical protein
MKNNLKYLIAFSLFATLNLTTTNTLYAQQNAIRFAYEGPGKITGMFEHAYTPKRTIVVAFQNWNIDRRKSSSASLIIGSTTTTTKSRVTGHRIEVMGRRYKKAAFQGRFFESGFYFGKHNITVVENSTTFNYLAIGFLRFDSISKSTSKTSNYKSVMVGGLKIGGGVQQSLGIFDLEFSGGLNMNAMNSHNVRPILPLKGISPYLRGGLSIKF